LPDDIQAAELRAVFEGIGPVEEVLIKENQKGAYAFVRMERPADADDALVSLNLFKIRDGK
jgi:hypothetical protein